MEGSQLGRKCVLEYGTTEVLSLVYFLDTSGNCFDSFLMCAKITQLFPNTVKCYGRYRLFQEFPEDAFLWF